MFVVILVRVSENVDGTTYRQNIVFVITDANGQKTAICE